MWKFVSRGLAALPSSSSAKRWIDGDSLKPSISRLFSTDTCSKFGSQLKSSESSKYTLTRLQSQVGLVKFIVAGPHVSRRCFSSIANPAQSISQDSSSSVPDPVPYVKFKRLDKTARHIMQIIDKEAVEEVRSQREIPDIRPGYIVQLKVEVPDNMRRVSTLKGIVIARRNAGLNSTFRIRRLVGGIGVESLFPLYSPNIKEIKVLEKKKVRRAKLYYLRGRMNALKK